MISFTLQLMWPMWISPWADGEEPPNILSRGGLRIGRAPGPQLPLRHQNTQENSLTRGLFVERKVEAVGGPITMYLTFLSGVGPRCLTTGSCNQPRAAMSNRLKD